MINCNLCNRVLQSHSVSFKCTVCGSLYHVNCLPNGSYSDNVNSWICINCISNALPFNHIEDDATHLDIITDFFHSVNTRLYDQLHNIVFNPFEINDGSNIMPLTDTDPDFNYYNDLSIANIAMNCNYFTEESFNKKFEQQCSSNSFSICHLNIRSASKNLYHFDNYLKAINYRFTIVALSETWVNNTTVDLCNLHDYTSEHLFRTNRRGGGVSLFILNSVEYSVRKDLNILNDNVEALFIEINGDLVNTKKNIIIGVLYRPPGTDILTFINYLSEVLSSINQEKKTLYILGDFNINLLNVENHSQSGEFLDTMLLYSYLPLITKPTRITQQSATLIDNIFTNNDMNNNILNGILFTDITDHYPIFTILNKSLHTEKKINIYRNYSQLNITKFKSDLDSYNWNNVYSKSECQEAFTEFHKTLTKLYNKTFPVLKSQSIYKNRKPWLTAGIKFSIKQKNKLYRISKNSPSNESVLRYKNYKRQLRSLIKKAETDYYEQIFHENKSNLKYIWRTIKDVINRKRNDYHKSKFHINGSVATDPMIIANAFNNFFINVGPSLANTLPHTDVNPLSYLPNTNKHSIFIEPTTTDEVKNIIILLKSSSPGHDEIHAKIIKATFNYFIDILVYLINLSFQQGVFPNELKHAKVIPIFKSGDHMFINNYRPISVLPTLSKIFEKIMYLRMLKFIEKHMLLYKYQFGFREKHSPALALIVLMDKISQALNNNESIIGIFLDFKKAFDTINHCILLNKLQHYGIRGPALKWFQSYLINRTQYVIFNDTNSKVEKIQCGVPQGSVLGPLLFLLYINDLANVSNIFFPILFADDTNVFIQGKNVKDIISNANLELDKIYIWLNANKLSLNIEKTKYMLFTNSRKNFVHNYIKLNNIALEKVTYTKFLGIIIDNKCLWSNHIDYIRNKIAKGLGILYKVSKIFSESILVTLYNSFIYPYLDYCIEIWGMAAQLHLESLLKMQKKAVRLIKSTGYLSHSAPLFKSLNILPINKIYIYKVSVFMYKFVNDISPDLFSGMFTRNYERHHYRTRFRSNFEIPPFRLNIVKKSVRYTGSIIWNYVSSVLDINYCIHTFKRHIKKHLFVTNIDII